MQAITDSDTCVGRKWEYNPAQPSLVIVLSFKSSFVGLDASPWKL